MGGIYGPRMSIDPANLMTPYFLKKYNYLKHVTCHFMSQMTDLIITWRHQNLASEYQFLLVRFITVVKIRHAKDPNIEGW